MAARKSVTTASKPTTKTKKSLDLFADAIEVVVSYCEKQGWEVRRGVHEDQAFPEDGYINLSTLPTNEVAFYTLLHEVGHMINAADPMYWEYYPGLKLKESNTRYKVAFIEEEADAWREGWNLAVDLGLESLIDLKKWDHTRCHCLFSHIRCQVNPRGFHK